MTSPSPPVFDQGAISEATKTRFICFPLATAGGTAGAAGAAGAGGAGGAAAVRDGGGGEGAGAGGSLGGAAEAGADAAATFLAVSGAAPGGATGSALPPLFFFAANAEYEGTGTGSFPPIKSHNSAPPPWEIAASWRASMSSRWSFLRCSICRW